MVLGRTGVPEDIPEVIWFMGMAPGAPLIVLGGIWVVVIGVGVGVGVLGPRVLEPRMLDELSEEPTRLGSCLSTRRALRTGRRS